MDASRLARMIDHTLLDPLASHTRLTTLCDEALEWGFGAVCVSPNRVAAVAERLAGRSVVVCSVVGFPSGAHTPQHKASEAAAAVAAGAREIDMVADLAAVASGELDLVGAEVAAVVASSIAAWQGMGGPGPRPLVKVILETAAVGEQAAAAAAGVAVAAGAGFVKTSTGYHPAGGATATAVAALAQAVQGRGGVKASGGIRTRADALTMLSAGATRLGVSRSVELVTSG